MTHVFPGRRIPEGIKWRTILLVSDDHRVTGVVSALAADDDIGLIGKKIDDLSLAFISPLSPDQNRIWHNAKTDQYCRPLPTRSRQIIPALRTSP